MKIDLEYPFTELYNAGYTHVSSEGRRYITLKKFNGGIDGTSYARYLMSVKLGRFLTDQEEVDHIDENRTNDDINNLQILTPEQNREKQRLHYINNVQQKFDLACPQCGKDFTLTERDMGEKFYKHYQNNGSGLIFCSRSCSGKFHSQENPTSNLNNRTKDEDLIQRIKSLRRHGLSSYKIADELKISRNTVMKYW